MASEAGVVTDNVIDSHVSMYQATPHALRPAQEGSMGKRATAREAMLTACLRWSDGDMTARDKKRIEAAIGRGRQGKGRQEVLT